VAFSPYARSGVFVVNNPLQKRIIEIDFPPARMWISLESTLSFGKDGFVQGFSADLQ